MKLLVIGAAGFVGRHLSAKAAREGHETLRTARAASAPGIIPFQLGCERIAAVLPRAFLEGDRPAGAVICAAESRIELCAREPDVTCRVNVTGTLELARDLSALGVRSVVLSSDHVFDGASGAYDETAATRPLNEYGRQKRALEERLLGEIPDSLVLRLSKVVGDDPAEAHLLSEWWSAMRRGAPIRCIRGQKFSPTWVEDAAAGIVLALQLKIAGLYHLAATETWGRAALAGLFAEMLSTPAQIIEEEIGAFGFAEARPLNTSLDGRRFARATGARFAPMATVIGRFRDRLGPEERAAS